MKAINPYLNFDGATREAMTLYASALDGDLHMQTFKESGFDVPGGADRIVHATISKDGNPVLMASDSQPGMPVQMGTYSWVSVQCDSESEQDRMFNMLSEGGQVVMPLDKTFWGARFGMLRDKFGISWMFNLELKT